MTENPQAQAVPPASHPMRFALNEEMHARPPESLPRRASISYLVIFGEKSPAPVARLCDNFGHEKPREGANHFSADLGPFRLTWEKHTEFTRFTFIVERDADSPLFAAPALEAVPPDWLRSLPGALLVANHLEIAPMPASPPPEEAIARQYFDGRTLISAEVAGGAAKAFSHFLIADDGFGRFLVFDNSMTPRQRGRTVQRLLELDTYIMMALLTLPVARDLMGELGGFEGELDSITAAMREAGGKQEQDLLDRLTLLHAEIVRRHTATQFRFSAARAYSELVALRITDLREVRVPGLQTFSDFVERRLGPAMRTCQSVEKRMNAVSARIAQATQLLSTRVDITRENQNQALLESMDRRAHLQLRLQETVEGLSVAAITYYIVGLVGYAAEGLKTLGWLPLEKSTVMLASIPVVVALVALGIRRIRKSLGR